jgi:hypothetical protein
MPQTRPRAPRPRAAHAAPLLVPALLGLCGCFGPARDAFPPVCPTASVLPGAGELTLYRPDGGRDLTDVQIGGSVLGASGSCTDGDTPRTVDATLSLRLRFQRGLAAPTRQANIPYFVAVARGEHILAKEVRTVRVDFPPNVDAVTVNTKPLLLTLPVGPDRSAAAYQVWVGFQRAAPG